MVRCESETACKGSGGSVPPRFGGEGCAMHMLVVVVEEEEEEEIGGGPDDGE